jgi:hypothetical protein
MLLMEVLLPLPKLQLLLLLHMMQVLMHLLHQTVLSNQQQSGATAVALSALMCSLRMLLLQKHQKWQQQQ